MHATKLQDLQNTLCQAGIPCIGQESLAQHTTFRIGGPAALYCMPATAQQLQTVLRSCKACAVPYCLLGNGSNVLFSDAGYDGMVVSLCNLTEPLQCTETETEVQITAGAGITLNRLCAFAQQRGLAGLAFAFGIPGTVGGAVYMNAGAYGGEVKDVLREVTFLDEQLQLRTLPAEQLELGYRTSVIEHHDWCIVSVVFALKRGDAAAIQAEMMEYMARRKDKQPLEYPSAGSTFKRPQGAFAGKLISDCGLAGFTVGGAQVSEKHCGFVINRGGATCEDVLKLTEQVKEIVLKKTGYTLEREIRVVPTHSREAEQ